MSSRTKPQFRCSPGCPGNIEYSTIYWGPQFWAESLYYQVFDLLAWFWNIRKLVKILHYNGTIFALLDPPKGGNFDDPCRRSLPNPNWSKSIHPWKLTCPPKRDWLFSREYIFQPLIFRGHVTVVFLWGIQPNTFWTFLKSCWRFQKSSLIMLDQDVCK